jgi:hypothetical protein
VTLCRAPRLGVVADEPDVGGSLGEADLDADLLAKLSLQCCLAVLAGLDVASARRIISPDGS